nr:phosphatase PAP2 family protein [uncultured Sphingomonas sp.]
MPRFLSPAIPAVLIVLFLVSGWSGGVTNGIDVAIVRACMAFRAEHPEIEKAAIFLTFFGSGYLTFALVGGGGIWLLLRQKKRLAALLVFGFAAERLAMDGIKLLYARPRPSFDLHPVAISSFSFPSGHASNSMAAFVLFALLAIPPGSRGAALWVAVPLAMLIGLSRPFLGVHWPTDVIGGWCLAGVAIWLVLRTKQRLNPGPA